METEVLDANNPFSVEGDGLILDLGLDTDSYDVPDPGLLKEKNGEVAWPCRRLPVRQQASLGRAFIFPRRQHFGQSTNLQGPQEGSWPPMTSRIMGPRPHGDDISTSDPQSCHFRSWSRSFLPAAHSGRT